MNEGGKPRLSLDRGLGRAVADRGQAGVKESPFLTHFLPHVFTSITTRSEQSHLVFSLLLVHQYCSQGWQSVKWHSVVPCPALCSHSLSHGKDLAAHSAQRVSSPTPRRPSEQNKTVPFHSPSFTEHSQARGVKEEGKVREEK